MTALRGSTSVGLRLALVLVVASTFLVSGLNGAPASVAGPAHGGAGSPSTGAAGPSAGAAPSVALPSSSAPTVVQNATVYCGTSSACALTVPSVAAGDALIYEVYTSEGCTVAPKLSTTPALTAAANDSAGPAPLSASANNAGNPGSPSSFCSWTWVYFNVPGGSTTFSFPTTHCPSGTCEAAYAYDYLAFALEVHGAARFDPGSTPGVALTKSGSGSTTLTLDYNTTLGGDLLYATSAALRCVGSSTRPGAWTRFVVAAYTNTCGNVGGEYPEYEANASVATGASVTMWTSQYPSAGGGEILALSAGASSVGATFVESGLPAGTSWSVTLNGSSPVSSTTPSISFALRNASYTYSIGAIAGYTTARFTGAFTVAGTSSTISVPFSAFTYAVSFSESGLSAGVNWSVSVGAATNTTRAGLANLFEEPNGSYAFTSSAVGSIQTAASCGSTLTVAGHNATCLLAFAPYSYPYEVQNATLWCGTSSACTVSLSGVTAHDALILEVETSQGCAAAPKVVLTPSQAFSANVSATALSNAGINAPGSPPSASTYCSWTWVYLNAPGGSTSASFLPAPCVVNATNAGCPLGSGSYDYAAFLTEITGASLIDPAANSSVAETPVSGSGSMSTAIDYNTSLAGDLLYSTFSYLRCTAGSPVPSGWEALNGVSASNTCGNVGGSGPEFKVDAPATRGGSVAFTAVQDAAGGGQILALAGSAPTKYPVTFTESNLPAGTSWGVSVAGLTARSTTSTLLLNESNGTYAYAVLGVPGWRAANASGTFTVAGGAAAVGLLFRAVDYALTFAENGLAAGLLWSVTVGGSSASASAPAPVVLNEPNGSYGYTLGAVNGYRATGCGATVTIAGGPVSCAVTFLRSNTFAVTFTESGLPAGTSWTVTLNGSSLTSSTASLTFAETNGTYAYNATPIRGYSTIYTGTLRVVGASIAIALAFAAVAYSVTFSETGLPAGSGPWSATLNGSSSSAAIGTPITFAGIANGSYPYTVPSVAGYAATPASGTLTVLGAPPVPAVGVSFAPVPAAPVAPSVVQNTSVYCGSSSACATTLSGVGGGDAIVFEVYTSEGCTVAPSVTTSPTIPASLNVTSGPVALNANANNPGNPGAPSIFCSWTWVYFSVPAGSETFTFPTTPCPAGTCEAGYTYDYLTFATEIHGTSGLDPGATGPLALTAPGAGATTLTLAYRTSVAGDFLYATSSALRCVGSSSRPAAWTREQGPGSTTNTCGNVGGEYPMYEANASVAASGSVVMWTSQYPSAGGGQILAFEGGYPITFTESGLASGTPWSVTVGGVTNSTIAPGSLGFLEPAGSYAFSVGAISHYVATPAAGSVVVSGSGSAPVTAIAFGSSLPEVSFTESGLPAGTAWGVTLNHNSTVSTASVIVFRIGNGTFGYNLSNVPGWRAEGPYASTVTVHGVAVALSVSFALSTYAITFDETGLAEGTSWSATLNGTTRTASAPAAIAFALPNGSYAYGIRPVANYTLHAPGDALTVDGAALVIAATFTAPWSVTFTETGLASGQAWGITFAGLFAGSTASAISFTSLNGTFAYNVSGIAGWRAGSYAGTVTVAGNDPRVGVGFSRLTYPVTFTETGLAAGASWSVGIGGTVESAVAPADVILNVANGSWEYQIGAVPGFTTTFAGELTVNAAPLSEPVLFLPVLYAVAFAESGLPVGTSWTIDLGGTGGGAVAPSAISFIEANGTFNYTVGNVPGFRAHAYLGHATVSGSNVSVTVDWSVESYTVTFTESGLPDGSSWSVTLNGTARSATASTIAFHSLPNATYLYQVGGVAGWTTSWSGSVTLAGSSAERGLNFTAFTYSAEFVRSGGPSALAWSVNATRASGGSPISVSGSSVGASIFLSLPNGSYVYTVTLPSGYSAPGGTVAVVGETPPPTSVAVTSPSSGSSAGVPWLTVGIGGAVAAVVVVGVLAALRGRAARSGLPPTGAKGSPAPPERSSEKGPAQVTGEEEESELYH